MSLLLFLLLFLTTLLSISLLKQKHTHGFIAQRHTTLRQLEEDQRRRSASAPAAAFKLTKRVLQLLLEIKDTIHVASSSAGTSYEVKPANTEQEFEALENCLEDKNEGAGLSKHLKRFGGVDAADLVKKSMAAINLLYHGRTMTNKMMAKMSLRGRSGKVAFVKTQLYKIVCGKFSLT
ncbi:hypothetical protein ATANTOWER_025083 [Ataeniobius toweri]|uniref:Uncharacterized protein n=1 Tax=Ataeniobius toweri TaxID=208326 RepID=A0ABU7B8F8_9TELE|nr:hypothetical protein [Ataeniobius toweri]